MEIKADPVCVANLIASGEAARLASGAAAKRVKEAESDPRWARSELVRHEGNPFVPEHRLIALRDAVEIARRNLRIALAEQQRTASFNDDAQRLGQAV